MKKLIFFIMAIILIIGTIYVVSLVSLITKNCNKESVYIVFNKGVFYEIHPFGESKGFCGILTDKFDDGYIHSVQYKDGKRNGIVEVFFENGNKILQSHYKDNQLEGKSFAWDSKGQLRIETTYKSGVVSGIIKRWNKDGSLIIQKNTLDINNSIKIR